MQNLRYWRQRYQKGGYAPRGIPYELVVHNDNGLWGASGNEIVDLAYKENVWAILGTIDGANSHIAIRVALKAEIPMVNTGDTDPTFVETNIPWVIRTIGDDRQQNYLLLDYLFRKMGYERIAIIRASNRYGRFGVREIKDGARRLGHPVLIEMACASHLAAFFASRRFCPSKSVSKSSRSASPEEKRSQNWLTLSRA